MRPTCERCARLKTLLTRAVAVLGNYVPEDAWDGNCSAILADIKAEIRPPDHARPVATPAMDGRALYRRARSDLRLLKFLGDLGRSQGWPGRIVDWSRDQATHAAHEAKVKLGPHPAGWGGRP